MKKVVQPYQEIPPFYGVAYIDYPYNVAVCYPLGINLLVILWRDCRDWLKHPKGRWGRRAGRG